MSLVEATIVLMVLAILTAVLAPAISTYVDDAKGAKAKEDVEAIGTAIVRLLNDTGFPFLVEDATVALADRFKMENRADLAISSGNIPVVQAGVDDGQTTPQLPFAFQAVTWTDTIAETDGKVSLYNQIVANTPGYPNPTTALGTVNPAAPAALGKFGRGWRGSYLSGVVGPDPWGFRYACSTVFLGTATDSPTNNEFTSGASGHGWAEDAVCLSAGRNRQIETNFDRSTFNPYVSVGSTTFSGTQNDDIVYVISGYGR